LPPTLPAALGFVALGLDDRQLHRDAGKTLQESRAEPLGLPQGEPAPAGSNDDGFRHQCLHPAQLPAWQPPQEEPADALTVWPPPLLTKPQADMRLRTFLLRQPLHSGFSLPKTRHSKSFPHFYNGS
jgi:hypothetical protein